jgi:hypothetical protein
VIASGLIGHELASYAKHGGMLGSRLDYKNVNYNGFILNNFEIENADACAEITSSKFRIRHSVTLTLTS